MTPITRLMLAVTTVFWAFPTLASDCDITISANDAMQFDTRELSVPASCKQVTLTLKHTGQLPAGVMGHNWVLTKTADMSAVATDGMSAGAGNAFVKPDDARVIAATDVIGGGASTSITFDTSALEQGQDYSFFCSFPGHWAIMQGKFQLT